MGPVRDRAGAPIVIQEGGAGYERLVVPACSLSPARILTIVLALGLGAADLGLIAALLSAAGPVTLASGALFLLVIPLTLLGLAFASEAVRILVGRESLSWEDVFLVHERRLPWDTTTKTLSISRVEGTAVAPVRSAHPMDLAIAGRRCLAIRTRDGVERVGIGLPEAELERLDFLTASHLTAARLRIGLRSPLP